MRMRSLRLFLFLLLVVTIPVLLFGTASSRADGRGDRDDRDKGEHQGAVTLLKTIPVPVTAANNTAGGLYSFDISFVDQSTQTYYLADRSNKVVDVVNAETATFLLQFRGTPDFRGFLPCGVGDGNPPSPGANDCAGPNGVVAAFPWLFVTDAGSRVVTIDVRNGNTVADVVTRAGDPTRADELAYDPRDGLLLVINNVQFTGHPPFATLINVNKATGALTVGTSIILDSLHSGVDAQNGAEQPVWHPRTGKFFLSIPQIGADPTVGGVVQIDPNTFKVEKTFFIHFCSPAGLTVGPHDDLLIGCNTVFDTAGKVWDPTGVVTAAPKDVILNVKTGGTKDVLGVGAGDEVWFNAGDGNYYATGSGSPFRPLPAATSKGATPLGVINADHGKLVQSVPTYNVPAGAGHPAGTAHSVAANAANNLVFVPLAANNAFSAFAVPGGGPVADCEKGCIAVFGRLSSGEDGD
jgi:hypothetical protein